jgi:hypothetical protein
MVSKQTRLEGKFNKWQLKLERDLGGGNFRCHYPGIVRRSVEPEYEACGGLGKAVAQVAFTPDG